MMPSPQSRTCDLTIVSRREGQRKCINFCNIHLSASTPNPHFGPTEKWCASFKSVQTRCIVKGEAQKSPLFWRFSGGFWFSQDRLLSRNSTRKPLNLIKSPIFTSTPCKSTRLYNAPSMHTVDSSPGKGSREKLHNPPSQFLVKRHFPGKGLFSETMKSCIEVLSLETSFPAKVVLRICANSDGIPWENPQKSIMIRPSVQIMVEFCGFFPKACHQYSYEFSKLPIPCPL